MSIQQVLTYVHGMGLQPRCQADAVEMFNTILRAMPDKNGNTLGVRAKPILSRYKENRHKVKREKLHFEKVILY